MAEKIRLDALLVERGLLPSRETAKAVIMSGNVIVNGEREDKAGLQVQRDAEIHIKEYEKKYVSRGGYKLEKAIDQFGITLTDAVCIDGGASTGGFTDCMLKNGAKKVYAVDVGYGQLAWSLRSDDRVVSMERKNLRYLTEEEIGEKVDFISIDVSFISLSLVVPPLAALMKEGAKMVALIKPQFEAGREKVGKKGVVRDGEVHKEVIERIISLVPSWNLEIEGLTFSPIRGPEGNIEFLIYLSKPNEKSIVDELGDNQGDALVERYKESVCEIVGLAHGGVK